MYQGTKLTVRLPAELHKALKNQAHETGTSLNRIVVEALWRSLPEKPGETDYDRTGRVLRECGLWKPFEPDWYAVDERILNMSHAELREMVGDVGLLSEMIIEDRGLR